LIVIIICALLAFGYDACNDGTTCRSCHLLTNCVWIEDPGVCVRSQYTLTRNPDKFLKYHTLNASTVYKKQLENYAVQPTTDVENCGSEIVVEQRPFKAGDWYSPIRDGFKGSQLDKSSIVRDLIIHLQNFRIHSAGVDTFSIGAQIGRTKAITKKKLGIFYGPFFHALSAVTGAPFINVNGILSNVRLNTIMEQEKAFLKLLKHKNFPVKLSCALQMMQENCVSYFVNDFLKGYLQREDEQIAVDDWIVTVSRQSDGVVVEHEVALSILKKDATMFRCRFQVRLSGDVAEVGFMPKAEVPFIGFGLSAEIMDIESSTIGEVEQTLAAMDDNSPEKKLLRLIMMIKTHPGYDPNMGVIYKNGMVCIFFTGDIKGQTKVAAPEIREARSMENHDRMKEDDNPGSVGEGNLENPDARSDVDVFKQDTVEPKSRVRGLKRA